MINLLKYDIKRNATMFLSLGVILALLQLTLSITGNDRGWTPAVIFGLSAMLYVFVGVFVFIIMARTYGHNIKAYSRRLLPIAPVWTVVSIMILGWICLVALVLMVVIHVLLYGNFYIDTVSPKMIFDEVILNVRSLVLFVFQGFWMATFLMLLVMLPITIAASIRGKIGVWTGIASFFILQVGFQWIETQLHNVTETKGLNMFVLSTTDQVVVPGTLDEVRSELFTLNWLTLGLEFLFMALMFYAIVLLLNRREQI